MQITKLIQTFAVLNIVLADNIENICSQYLENIDILTSFNGQSSLIEKENTYYIGSNQEQTFTKEYCTDIKLWKYQQFNDPIELQSIDDNQLIFQISDIRIEDQYYAFTYKSQNIKFKVQNRKIEYIDEENQRRLLQENIPIESKLNFCWNEACMIILTDPEIYLNDQFFIQQIVTDSNYSDYYLINTSIKYVGIDLNYQATSITIDNTIKGQVILLLQASIWSQKLQIQIFSNFSNTINGSSLPYTTLSTINTTFKPLNQYNTASCLLDCPIPIESYIQLCSDYLCTTDLDPNSIHYNDEIFVQQIITTEDQKYLYLNLTQITFTGNGLYKAAYIIAVDNSEKGKLKALLKIDIVWRGVTIQIESNYFSDENPQNRTNFKDQIISAYSPTIECIKVNNTCPTCKDQCQINNFSILDQCSPCMGIYIRALKNIIIILLIILL